MEGRCSAFITWGSLEMKMRSGHSGEVRPRCQSSSGRTGGSFGMKALRSCKELQLLLENGSSDPSKPWKRQKSRRKQRQRWRQKEKCTREDKSWFMKGGGWSKSEESGGFIKEKKRVVRNLPPFFSPHNVFFGMSVLLASLHSGLWVGISKSFFDALNQDCSVSETITQTDAQRVNQPVWNTSGKHINRNPTLRCFCIYEVSMTITAFLWKTDECSPF